MNKYKNKKMVVDGIIFDSVKEKNRYLTLKLYEKVGAIKDLELQVKFELQPAFSVNGKRIRKIEYIADFVYYDNNAKKQVVEDVKGYRTKEFLLKRKLFAYKYGFEISEV